jgi:cell wall-associated NlpC family hydrolase
VQRDLFNPEATVTLMKPQTTLKDAESANPIQSVQVLQPSGTTKSQAAAIITGEQGNVRDAIVAAAKKAVALQARDGSSYIYEETVRAHQETSLFGHKPVYADCSSFVSLCYKAAGAPDPSGFGYSPLGDTASLVARGTQTSTPQPGDLVFWGPLPKPQHVALYIGGNQIVNMGVPGQPVIETIPITILGNPQLGFYTYDLGPLHR